jgi:hypothetical protein
MQLPLMRTRASPEFNNTRNGFVPDAWSVGNGLHSGYLYERPNCLDQAKQKNILVIVPSTSLNKKSFGGFPFQILTTPHRNDRRFDIKKESGARQALMTS